MLPPLHELGDEPAVSVGDRGLSYRELREAAAAAAAGMKGAERVGVWADASLEACVAVVAACAVGVPFVPVNPKLGVGELTHVLSDSRPDLLFGAPPDALPELEQPPRLEAVDVDARGGELPTPERDD
jgi:malonyl-CoA/methylmalonyl-CoA synthetase